MTTREYLKQVERLDRMIENKLAEITQLEQMATSVTVQPKEVNVQSSGSKDKIGSIVAKIVDLENEADGLVDQFIDKRREIVNEIASLEDTDAYNVLTKRYVLQEEWKQIAYELGLELRGTMAMHDRALRQFEKKFGDKYLDQELRFT